MAATSALAQHDEGDANGSVAFHLRDLILGGQDGLVNVLGLVLGRTAAGRKPGPS